MQILLMIKKNFYTVVKLWVNQFAMMFLGFLVLLPAGGEKAPDWLMPAASAFTVLFYFALIFWVCCEVGLHDSVSIECGKMKAFPLKCTVLSLVANLPSLVASVVACISKAMIPGVSWLSSAQGASGGAANIYSVSTGVNEVLHVMYRGLFLFFDVDGFPFIYFPVVLLSLAVCTVGYISGTKGYFAGLLQKKNKY